jgi:hypothetical protein
MIKRLIVINYLDESISFDLRNPEESGFFIEEIEGLGPAKANINAVEFATNDGSIYNSARVGSRNILLRLGFLFKPSIEAVRYQSYKFFPIKRKVTLIFETDTRLCETYGYVESNEPVIFSKRQTTQISIVCPDPYFYSLYNNVLIFNGEVPSFEFEFSNESLTEKMMIFGEVINKTTETVWYEGDAEVGVIIKLNATGNVSNLAIHNTYTFESMEIDTVKLAALTGSGIITGDEITISTIKGNKYIELLRNGVTTNILNCLNRDADWFQLSKGDNIFSYAAETGTDNLQLRIEHQIVYEGV